MRDFLAARNITCSYDEPSLLDNDWTISKGGTLTPDAPGHCGQLVVATRSRAQCLAVFDISFDRNRDRPTLDAVRTM
jgi:hypothetical protein